MDLFNVKTEGPPGDRQKHVTVASTMMKHLINIEMSKNKSFSITELTHYPLIKEILDRFKCRGHCKRSMKRLHPDTSAVLMSNCTAEADKRRSVYLISPYHAPSVPVPRRSCFTFCWCMCVSRNDEQNLYFHSCVTDTVVVVLVCQFVIKKCYFINAQLIFIVYSRGHQRCAHGHLVSRWDPMK